jgi:hypothetical protein
MQCAGEPRHPAFIVGDGRNVSPATRFREDGESLVSTIDAVCLPMIFFIDPHSRLKKQRELNSLFAPSINPQTSIQP